MTTLVLTHKLTFRRKKAYGKFTLINCLKESIDVILMILSQDREGGVTVVIILW